MKTNKAILAVLSLFLIIQLSNAINNKAPVLKATHYFGFTKPMYVIEYNNHEYLMIINVGLVHSESCICKLTD